MCACVCVCHMCVSCVLCVHVCVSGYLCVCVCLYASVYVSVPVRTEPVSNGSRFDSVRCSVRISFEPFEHLITNSLPCIPAPRVHNDDWFVVLVYFMYKYMLSGIRKNCIR